MRAVLWDKISNLNSIRQKIFFAKPETEILYLWVDDEKLAGRMNDGILYVTYEKMVELWNLKEIDTIILSANKGDTTLADNVWTRSKKVKEAGIDAIYIIPSTLERMPLEKMSDTDKENIIIDYKDFTELPVIKWLLFEGCNLNCSGCSHFAPLNKNPKMLSVEEFHRDMLQLKKKFHYLREIQFLGGEPLMNKNLSQFIDEAYEMFPYSYMSLITNGLLLPSLKDEVFKKIKERDVVVWVT